MSLKKYQTTLLTTYTVILCCLIPAPAQGVVLRNYCDILPKFPMNYTKIVLVESDSNTILDIAVSRRSEHIYFVDSQYKLGILKKGETQKREIAINDTIANAVAFDYTRGKLYVGCDSGLKNYDEDTGIFTNILSVSNWIRHIFIPHTSTVLYAVMDDYYLYSFQSLTAKGTNLSIKIDNDSPHAFSTDYEGNYFYTINKNGNDITQVQSKYYPKPITFCDGTFFSLASDNSETVFGLASRGLYRLQANDSVPELITVLDFSAKCLSFDKNNDVVIGASDGSIVLLKIDEENYKPPVLGPIYTPTWPVLRA